MRGAAFVVLGLIPALGPASGCHTAKHDVSVPQVEEYRTAPDDPAYNTPPEKGYTKPAPKKEFKPGMSGGAGGGGMGGGSGMGR